MSDGYFAEPSSSDPASLASPQFLSLADDVPAIEISPGLLFQPAVGERLMINLVTFAPWTEAPLHTHDEEQVVYVLSGELAFTVGDVERTLKAGDVVIIPPFVPHGAKTHEHPCTELDLFAPPRQALLRLMAGDPADGSG